MVFYASAALQRTQWTRPPELGPEEGTPILVSPKGGTSSSPKSPIGDLRPTTIELVEHVVKPFRDEAKMPSRQASKLNVHDQMISAAAITHEKSSPDIEHTLTIDEVTGRYLTNSTTGLSEAEAASRLARDGPNSLTLKPPTPIIFKILIEFVSGFSLLLWGCAVVCVLAYTPFGSMDGGTPDIDNLNLTYVLIGVIVFNVLFNVYQEVSTDRVLETFQKGIPKTTIVIRDGARKEVPMASLVIGDLVAFSLGVNAPADLRVVSATSCKMDVSAMTGESLPVQVTPLIHQGGSEATFMEASNIMMLGSKVVEGNGTGLVIRTGDNCTMSSVIRLSTTESTTTNFHREIRRVVLTITGAAFFTASVLVLCWGVWLRPMYPGFYTINASDPFANATFTPAFLTPGGIITSLIGIMVSYVPEGLPAAVTITLALIARRLVVKHNVLVTKLGMVETLGGVSLVVSDKTGTLTCNQMTLRHSSLGTSGKVVDLLNPRAAADFKDNRMGALLLRAAVLCNGADVSETEDIPLQRLSSKLHVAVPSSHVIPKGLTTSKSRAGSTIQGGGALDRALASYVDEVFPVAALRRQFPKLAEIPFSSANKYMLSICSDQEAGASFILMKGAPEMILDHCSHSLSGDGQRDFLTQKGREQIVSTAESLGNDGERVIGVAQLYLDPLLFPKDFHFETEPPNFPIDGLTFVGLLAVADPPRASVKDSIDLLRSAGVQVCMCTGDHRSTAVAIARQVGLVQAKSVVTLDKSRPAVIPNPDFRRAANRTSEEAVVILGHQVEDIDIPTWNWVFSHDQIVFSRMSPAGKRIVVQQAQRCSHLVAVTGDGVNDAPALKTADVGVAMGSGSDVARQSADIVLIDDDFGDLCYAVQNGRLAFDNLKKVLVYVLPAGTFSEVISVLVNVLLGTPVFLSSFYMIIISCATDFFACLALVFEPPESDLMARPPRDIKKARLIDWKLLLYVYGFLGVLDAFAIFIVLDYALRERGFTYHDWLLAYNHPLENGLGTEDVCYAQSLYFVGLVMCQLCNLISTRTRYTPIFFRCFNKYSTLYGGEEVAAEYAKMNFRQKVWFRVKELLPWNIVIGISAAILWVIILTYAPAIQHSFCTRPVEAKHGVLMFCFGLLLMLLADLRKVMIQAYPTGIFARLAW